MRPIVRNLSAVAAGTLAIIGAHAALHIAGTTNVRNKTTIPVNSPSTGNSGGTTTPESNKLKLGMNLAGLANYTPEEPLLNRFKMGGWWNVRGQDLDKSLLNADGWPIAMPKSGGFFETAVPLDPMSVNTERKYVLRWKGTGTVSVGIVGKTDYEDHKITFENAYGSALINVMATSKTDPIRDITVVRADQVAAFNKGEIFNPTFLDRVVKQFPTIRTMDWDLINNSEETNFTDRQKPNDAFYTRMPLEIEVALANKTGADLWKTIPAKASDDYVRQTLTYIRDNLAPGVKVHIEYTNEIWNGGFAQNKWAGDMAKARWRVTSWEANTYYGYRAAQVASIGWSIFGKDSTRFVPVLAGWYGWVASDVTDAMTKGVSFAKVGTVSALFREYAIAPYFGDALGVGPGNEPDRATVLSWALDSKNGLNRAFQQIEHGGLLKIGGSSLDDAKYTFLPPHAAFAKRNGLALVGYEGGLSIYFFMSDNDKKPALKAFFDRLVADPRMGTLYTRWMTDFQAAGGKLLAAYNDVGEIGEFGTWGALPNVYSAETPRYAAMKAIANK